MHSPSSGLGLWLTAPQPRRVLTRGLAGAILVATKRNNKELQLSCADRLSRDLRAAGYRVTPQRLIILEAVAHARDHTSAQQVFAQARRRLPGLNPATVYRTMRTLHAAGLVDLYTNGGQALRFSLRDAEHPHAHLVCRSCGRELELDPSLVKSFSRTVERRTGFQIDAHHLTLGGVCNRCSSP